MMVTAFVVFAIFSNVACQEEPELKFVDFDWCSQEFSCYKPNGEEIKNSACSRPNVTALLQAGSFQRVVTESNRTVADYWLALMNTLRDRIAAGRVFKLPPATNMQQLLWSDILEEEAYRGGVGRGKNDDPCCMSPVGSTHPAKVSQHNSFDKQAGDDKQAWAFCFGNAIFSEKYRKYSILAFTETKDRMTSMLMMAAQRYVGAALYAQGENKYFHTYMAPDILHEYAQTLYLDGHPCTKCAEGFKCNPSSTYKYLCAGPDDPSDLEYVTSNWLDGNDAPFDPKLWPTTSITEAATVAPDSKSKGAPIFSRFTTSAVSFALFIVLV